MNKNQNRLKRISSIAGLVLLVNIAFGQSFNAGLFGGLTASQVDGDSYSGYSKVGITAGAFVNQHIDHDFYGQIEIKYIQRGVYQGPSDYDQTLFRSTYHYIEIPLSVHYLPKEKLFFEMGISPEVLLGVVYRDENGILNSSTYAENRRFGLSVFAGIGYWFSPTMGLDMRYTHSAFPFRETEEWNNAQYRGLFHSVISLSLVFKIRHE